MNNALYYDYDLQVWVKEGTILDCNHPNEMKDGGCCAAHKLAGLKPENVGGK